MNLPRVVQFLRLNQISSAWVDASWDYEFTEVEPLDTTIEEEITADGEKAFGRLYDCLLLYTSEEGSSVGSEDLTQSVWALFGENGVSVRSLVAVLSYFVLKGKVKSSTGPQRAVGLHAASLYLLLLGIPGSIANQVFHQVLFDICIDLTTHCWPQDSTKKRKKDSKNVQVDGKRSKPPRKDNIEMEVDEAEEDEHDEEERVHLSSQDLLKIREGVVLLVQSLLRLLLNLFLKDKGESASSCIQVLTKLIYFEPVIGEITFSAQHDISKLKTVPELAFYGLRLLCSPHQGDQQKAVCGVFHRLLYVVLMMSKASGGKPSLLVPSQSVLAARNLALAFICHLVEELKEVASPFLQILLQHICFMMVEKTEYRCHGAQAIGTLVSEMACEDYSPFIKWLYDYSRNSKIVYRLFSVDVVMVLLQHPERAPEDALSPELVPFLPHKFLIQGILFGRRTDASPTVRAHVLSCLAQCLELQSLNITRAMHDLFSASGTSTVLETRTSQGTLGFQQTQKTYQTLPFKTVELTSVDSASSDVKENLSLILKRVTDPNTNVRKSALQALAGLLKHNVIPMTSKNLSVLSERSRDPALSVKKKALQCMGELLMAWPDSGLVQRAWLHCVVPAVMDSESSIQEKALESMEQVLLSQVKLHRTQGHLDTDQRLTWDLLNLLCHECQDLSQYFSRVFTVWSKQNKFTSSFITNLISHTETEHSAGAWLMLSKVASSSPKIPCGKILDCWDNMISSKSVSVATSCHILSVMGDICRHLNDDTRSRVVEDLMSRLKAFDMSLEVISASMDMLFQLGYSEDIKRTQAFMDQHCGELLSLCESFLSRVLLSQTGTQNLDMDLMVKHLHTLGVASLHCPARVSNRTVLLVESVLTSHTHPLTDSEELPVSQPLSQFRSNSLPSEVRAHGVITLGKLCLQHVELTQRYLPVFARELEVGVDAGVRNNVVVVLCDLCVRYTNLVDRYVPNVSVCLRGDQRVIREQALIMLTNLLQEEFVKWKGSLFFHFVAALVDPVPAIASLCEYCLVHRLLKKNPAMFSQHFIECIFYFNSYSKHKVYNKFPQTDREKLRFSLKGAQHREKRFRIYRFLLEHFTDSQRLTVTGKINQTILACFADEELPLDTDGVDILDETFLILGLKEMKVQANPSPAAQAPDPEEENLSAKAILQVAHKNMMSQVQKKAFITNTIPNIIALKNTLQQKRSPALRYLMAYLQVAMQDYRGMVKEFFSGDEQLAAELGYILNSIDQERLAEQQLAQCTLGGEPSANSIPVSGQAIPEGRLPGFITPPPSRPALASLRLTQSNRLQADAGRSLSRGRFLSLGGTVLAKGTENNRAISTPVGTSPQESDDRDVPFNVTFGEEGISAILSEQRTGSENRKDSNVLNLLTMENQTPAGRQWNIQSPIRQKRRQKMYE